MVSAVAAPKIESTFAADFHETDLGVLPNDWDVVELGKIGSAFIGLTYSPRDVSADGTLVLRSSNVQNGRLRFDDNVYVNVDVPDRATVRENDILICVRNGSRDLIGKSAVIDAPSAGMAFGAFMGLYRSEHNSFLAHVFKSDLMLRQIHEHLGATINQITNKSLNGFKAPLPKNPDECKAIAEALSDAEAIIGSLEQLIAKKRQIKQGTMTEILFGRTRLAGFIGKWETRKFGAIATIRNDKITTLGADVAAFCVELEHIDQGTGQLLGFSDARSRASLKYSFQKSDVLFGRLRPYLRKFWRADRSGVCSTEIWPLIPKSESLIAEFLAQIVQTDPFVEAAGSSYGTHMPRTDWKALAEHEIALPKDLEEQRAIAAMLSEMDDELELLTSRLAKAQQIKQGMMQELLTGRVRLV